ncbi:hypothetical protein FOZ63_005219 [Perkinsus olseni]|uniref:Uncharacterized protein n=1 Tax=Perkinsus olseni TaxID=32597 RepID=A0A7J6N4G8_PEROL|nr:hypothetical protein FOZ62_006974 [Perkinsus olseni]KAF4704837.1 hypothetical protein FOZ63_005219 [Perkinsus olseni]
MPPKQFIIGASAAVAVALLAKLPFSRAVKTVASHHSKNVDDYLQRPSRFEFMDNTTECSYGNGLIRAGHMASLKGTGLNPLRHLNQSMFRGELDSLYSAVRSMLIPTEEDLIFYGEEYLKAHPREYPVILREKDMESLTEVEEDVMIKSRAVCSAVLKAIKASFGTFKKLCAEYYREAKAAVRTARRLGWRRDHNGDVRPPAGEVRI